jgi:hypothetical protein
MTYPLAMTSSGQLVRIVVIGGSIALLVASGAATLGATPTPAPAATPGPSASPTGRVLPGWGEHPEGHRPFRHFLRDRLGARGPHPITVTAIDGREVSLGTEDGWTRTVTVGPEVKVLKDRRELGLDGLGVGDHVRLVQTRLAGGTYEVERILIVPERRDPADREGARGRVTSKGTDSVTLTRRDGTQTIVHVAPATRYRVRGGPADAGLADLAIGDRVLAVGTQRADGSLDARVVLAGRPSR